MPQTNAAGLSIARSKNERPAAQREGSDGVRVRDVEMEGAEPRISVNEKNSIIRLLSVSRVLYSAADARRTRSMNLKY
jgi:hypothetical protein